MRKYATTVIARPQSGRSNLRKGLRSLLRGRRRRPKQSQAPGLLRRFAPRNRRFAPPRNDERFSLFAKKVYNVVLSIPLGEMRTYKWVARKAGSPKAYRAVGSALKKNPYPLIIPCHRVIKSNNDTGGYAFGIKKKKLLLELEKRLAKKLLTNR